VTTAEPDRSEPPPHGGDPLPASRRSVSPRPWGRLVLGAALVVVGVAWLLDATNVAVLDWAIVLAVTLVLVGAGMIAAAREGWHGGLFAAGVTLSIGALTIAAVPVPVVGDVGERAIRPTSLAEVEDRYDHAVGQLIIDLGGVEFDDEDEVELSVRLGVGDLLVIVPTGVEVHASARVGVGQATVLDRTGAGFGVRVEPTPSDDEGGVLVVDAQLGVGQVVIQP
jgi:hypothetical protein